MQQLYVCSRPLLGKNGEMQQHLIGMLSKLDNGEFQFEYKLDDSIESNRLLLSIFPDKHKIYNDTETRILLDDYLPSENDTAFITEILKKSGLKQYDEWTWLLTFDSDDVNTETFLYEELPPDVIRHDITDNTSDDTEFFNEDDNENADSVCTNETNFDDILFDEDFMDDLPFDDIKAKNSDTETDDLEPEFPEDNFEDVTASHNTQPVINLPNNSDIIKSGEFIEKLDPKPRNTVKIVTIKTTRKRRTQTDIDDFIEPPPESPIDKIQQRLIENQKLRQERLAEQLKANPYAN